MRQRLHRPRLLIALAIMVATPVWLVVAVATGGGWIVPAVITGQVAYYVIRGFMEGLHRVRREMLPVKLRMQEKLAQDCTRLGGGFYWPPDDDHRKVDAYGFPSGNVHVYR